MKFETKKLCGVLAVFAMMFFLGRGIAQMRLEQAQTVSTSAVLMQAENWGLGFGTEGTKPTGNATAEELKQYNAYFVGSGDEKKLYLTFDCGYEN